MKMFASVIALGTLSLVAVCDLCQPSASASTAAQGPAHRLTAAATAVEQKTVTLRIEGMTCGGCAIATRKVLARLPGVSRVEVSYEQQQALVTYDPVKVTADQMIAAVRTLGYRATLVREQG
jgi:mercuric transport protein